MLLYLVQFLPMITLPDSLNAVSSAQSFEKLSIFLIAQSDASMAEATEDLQAIQAVGTP